MSGLRGSVGSERGLISHFFAKTAVLSPQSSTITERTEASRGPAQTTVGVFEVLRKRQHRTTSRTFEIISKQSLVIARSHYTSLVPYIYTVVSLTYI